MLTDRQSIFLCTLVVVGFVVFGILNILERLYIAIPIMSLFGLIIINLLITKRHPKTEAPQDIISKTDNLES
ncbi:hypothetical protein ACFS5M_10310 [Lacinutrix iliipiscaria]|uniref:Uncharacterized protein n=1 Tax=Lacinutrix iliipiscaria TaxID=1230532 RepID=A0ABW5WS50_9FLAO